MQSSSDHERARVLSGISADLAGLSTQTAQALTAAGVAHGFATRTGGISTVYLADSTNATVGELNLGFTPTDERANVLENRRRLLVGTFGSELPLVTLHQIHSSISYRVGRDDAGRSTPLQGDGLMTNEPGVVLGVQTADCVPVLVADRKRGAVAAFHAGWRGTVRRIVESGVAQMRAEFGSEPADLVAAIGPSIRSCCYAVGEEVRAEFRSRFGYADELFCERVADDRAKEAHTTLLHEETLRQCTAGRPRLFLDLALANRRQLLDAGLSADAIGVTSHCTSCRGDLYFSHRAGGGFAGRMMNVIAAR
jgi:YfiH family protein